VCRANRSSYYLKPLHRSVQLMWASYSAPVYLRRKLVQNSSLNSSKQALNAQGHKPRLEYVVPDTPGEGPRWVSAADLYREGTDYYRTPRARWPSSVNWYVWRSVDLRVGYSSFALNEVISPHPLLVVAGGEADTLYFSEESYCWNISNLLRVRR
jgi:hypothetical protein